jgi:hypothetical protein
MNILVIFWSDKIKFVLLRYDTLYIMYSTDYGHPMNLGRSGRQNMLRPYLKIWEWEWIFGRSVKAISSLGVRSP